MAENEKLARVCEAAGAVVLAENETAWHWIKQEAEGIDAINTLVTSRSKEEIN